MFKVRSLESCTRTEHCVPVLRALAHVTFVWFKKPNAWVHDIRAKGRFVKTIIITPHTNTCVICDLNSLKEFQPVCARL